VDEAAFNPRGGDGEGPPPAHPPRSARNLWWTPQLVVRRGPRVPSPRSVDPPRSAPPPSPRGGVPRLPTGSLVGFLSAFSSALRRGVAPEGRGYAYLGLDVIRAADHHGCPLPPPPPPDADPGQMGGWVCGTGGGTVRRILGPYR